MTSISTAPDARPTRLLARWGLGVVLLVVGVLVDMCAVMNVPGAATFPAVPGGRIGISGLGLILVLVAIGCWSSVLWRRRHPLWVVVAGCVLAVIGVSYLLLLVGVVAAARAFPHRLRALGAIVVAVVAFFALRESATQWGGAYGWFFASQSVAQHDASAIIAPIVIAVISLGVTATLVLALAARRRADASDMRAEHELRRADALSEQVVRQTERDRIARDMHDSLAHRLSVVSLHAGALEKVAAGPAGDIARTVREQTHAALQDMRGLIGDLRSGPDDASPSTMRAIGPLLSDLRRGGIRATGFVVVEAPERASAQFDSAVHRIVQEALTNAIKHAPGAEIDAFVEVHPDAGARIRIVNPLRPVEGVLVPGGGHGTLGIRERAEALGGTAWIGSHGGEFIVDVTLPWQERA